MSSLVDWSVVGIFALMWAAIVPTPGANSLMLTHIALTQTSRHVGMAIAGNMCGILVLASAALAGMAGLLSAFPWLRLAIHILGAAYLVWFGARLLYLGSLASTGGGNDGGGDSSPISLARAWSLGILTQLSNAQAIVFITSIFAAAGVLDASVATGLVCIAAIIVMNASYLSGLGWLFRLPSVRKGYARWRAALLSAMGVLFAGFGVRLLWRELATMAR